jgi:hypothetical protein
MELQEAFDQGFLAVKKFLDAELARFEARLAKLEAAPQLKYTGTFETGRKYQPGEFTTDDGSLWACVRETTTRPGAGDAWKLACKRGRDGRDAR